MEKHLGLVSSYSQHFPSSPTMSRFVCLPHTALSAIPLYGVKYLKIQTKWSDLGQRASVLVVVSVRISPLGVIFIIFG